MKYSKVELGQIEAVLNIIGGVEGMRLLLAGELKVVPASEVLVRDGSFSPVELGERHDPREFYQTREGLYVWEDFVSRIVAAASPIGAGRTFGEAFAWKLTIDATGETLRKERPEDVWPATDFCAWLSAKLAKQPGGESGELLNTGRANLFLVEGVGREVFVVSVRWDPGYRRWDVRAWRLGNKWFAGYRFASKPI